MCVCVYIYFTSGIILDTDPLSVNAFSSIFFSSLLFSTRLMGSSGTKSFFAVEIP